MAEDSWDGDPPSPPDRTPITPGRGVAPPLSLEFLADANAGYVELTVRPVTTTDVVLFRHTNPDGDTLDVTRGEGVTFGVTIGRGGPASRRDVFVSDAITTGLLAVLAHALGYRLVLADPVSEPQPGEGRCWVKVPDWRDRYEAPEVSYAP